MLDHVDKGETMKIEYVDSGWAWVSLTASSFGNFVAGFIAYSIGIFHIALLEEFKEGNTLTSVVGSIFSTVICLLGPFVGVLVNATSCRVGMILGGLLMFLGFSLTFFAENLTLVIATYSIMAGAGCGFCVVSSPVVIGYSFKKYLGMANGVATAAAGCGMFASGPLAQYLLDEYGLHGAFLLMGGVSSQCIIAGSLMRPSATELNLKSNRNLSKEHGDSRCAAVRNILDFDLLKNKSFFLVALATVMWHVAYVITFIHLPNISVINGSDKFLASFLLLEIGVGSVIGRLLSGLAVGSGLDALLLELGILGVLGLVTLFFPLYSAHFWQQSIFALLFGIYGGGLNTLIVPIAIEIVGIQHLASALGVMYFAGGVGYLTGPPIIGFIMDQTGHYESCFYSSGVCLTTGSLLVLFSTLWRPKDIDRNRFGDNTEIVLKGSNTLSGSDSSRDL